MEFITNYHGDYTSFQNDWQFYIQSYVGGRQYTTDANIFQHLRETEQDYNLRLKRAVYTNYCRSVVDLYTSFIFGVETHVMRDVEAESYLNFQQDVDLRGNNIDDFMQQVSTYAQIFGFCGILIDSPPRDDSILTLKDQQDSGIRPYLCVYQPPDIVNWALDRFGQLIWVRLKENNQENDDPFGDEEETTHYRTFTRDEWFLHDDQQVLIDSDTHGLGRVPFVCAYFQKHPQYPFVGLSQLVDIAPINRLLANINSYIDEFVSKQAFPFLASSENPMMPDGQEPESIISASNVFNYPQGGQPPSYVSPPTDPAQFMQDYSADYLIQQILRAAHLDHRALAEQSGVAKQYDFHQLNHVLSKFSRNLEMAELQVMDIYHRWTGQESEPVQIDYPDNFEIETISQALANSKLVREIFGDKSPTFTSEHLRRMARRLTPKLEEGLAETIAEELEESATSDAQALAFDEEMQYLTNPSEPMDAV
jgi:hypothetical protein